MFRENSDHKQLDMFLSERRLPKQIRKKLDTHWSSVFYQNVFFGIKESDFSVIYSDEHGRPNFPVNILVGLEIIKEMYGYSDEKLYDSFFFDYSIQRALGVEDIEEYYFSIRTWYNFRAKLAMYEYENGISLIDKVFIRHRDDIIAELKIKTDIQRMDSVMISANIKKMNRLTLFHKVLSNLVKLLVETKISVDRKILELVKDDEDSVMYRLDKDKVYKTTHELANILFLLVNKHGDNSDIIHEKAFIDALRLIDDQCDIHKEKRKRGKWLQVIKLKDPKNISSGSLQNPADPDATYRKKKEKQHQGYVTHGTETCDPDNPMQVVTSVATEKNNVDDAKVGAEELQDLTEETDLTTLITDGGYHSPNMSKVAEEEGVEIFTTAIRGRKPQEDLLNTESFAFDDSEMITSCPDGHRPIKQTKKDGILKASFDRRICKSCKLKSKCIAYISEKQSRLVVDANRRWLDKRNCDGDSEKFKLYSRLRPPVEALMEKLKPKYLSGRTLFRGKVKVSQRMILRGIGVNFRRYLALMVEYFAVFLARLDFSKFGNILTSCQVFAA